ncbi:MAG TPA: phage major tail tube protein [Ancylobacter sp.]
MDPIKVGHVTNADVYLTNNRLAGRCKEFDPGDIGMKMVSHEALGMIGVIELPSRAIEAIKGKIVFDFIDHEVDRTTFNPTTLVRLALHSYVDVWDSEGLNRTKSHRLVTTIGVHFAKISGMGHSLGEAVNRELEISIVMMTQKVTTSEVPVLEYDVYAGIYRVNGENVWPD